MTICITSQIQYTMLQKGKIFVKCEKNIPSR